MNNRKFLFIGNRLSVFDAMLEANLDTKALISKSDYILEKINNKNYKNINLFDSKEELLTLINKYDFDILVSNGCPYILPVSKIKKDNQIFVNIHPSLLPKLRGPNPVNASILLEENTGATCHIMDDNIDSGDIISRVPIYNNHNIRLPLLYEMCFLAEKEAFKIALENNFIPIEKQIKENSYYVRKDEDLIIDFNNDKDITIIKKVRAFSCHTQMARFYFNNRLFKVKSAKCISNIFLDSMFKNYQNNDVVLIYDNYILCKRENVFLELEIIDKIQGIININNNLVNKNEIDSNKYTIFNNHKYIESLINNNENNIFNFIFKKGEYLFINKAITSKIPNTKYYDMVSPYGYSGYYTNSNNIEFLNEAIINQSIKANQRNIIAEFIRFNPYYPYTKYFKNIIDFFDKAKDIIEVATDSDIRMKNYSPRLKTKLRKSLKLLTIEKSNDLNTFKTLYRQTMLRNNADNFYYFSDKYFDALIRMEDSLMLSALFENEICAMGIFLFDKICGYYHLGANAQISINNNLNAMGAIFETFFQIANKKSIKKCILGGGRNNDNNDSLFIFKKQFATSIIPFYIGGKIYNKDIFNELKKDNDMFLSYRGGVRLYQIILHYNHLSINKLKYTKLNNLLYQHKLCA